MKITKATQKDFDQLNKVFPQTEQGINEFRIGTQNDGKAEYLLAKDVNGNIIGKLYLKFFGANDEPVKSRITDCPDLENIEVIPEYRGQGIGTKLINEAEKICKEKGFQKVGLGVSIENELARKLYERLGYEDSGLGEFDISFMWRSRPEEPEHEINERVVYLIKKI